MKLELIDAVIRRQRRRALGDALACIMFPVVVVLTSGLLLTV